MNENVMIIHPLIPSGSTDDDIFLKDKGNE